MPWDLVSARAHIGLVPGDTTNDVALQANLDSILDEVETLLGRGLYMRRVRDVFYRKDNRDLILSRYPIVKVYSPRCTIIHHRVGWIEPAPNSWCSDGTIVVDYLGGFKELPSALDAALWGAFSLRWKDIDHITGSPLDSGPTVTAGSGDVSRVSFGNFGSVGFDVGSTVTNAQADLSDQQRTWGWLSPWATILNAYRSHSAPGVAFA